MLVACAIVGGPNAWGQYPSSPQITKNGTTILLEDYATAPLSGRGGSINNFGPHVNFSDQLSRANLLRSEPADAPMSSARFFVGDLNRNLYVLDKETRTFIPYINFQSVFPELFNGGGYATGLVTFAFDPGYASNGIFYTVHVENPGQGEPPITDNLPGLSFGRSGYSTTTPINPPTGGVAYEDVLVEWTDTDITNTTFEGTARELLRIGENSRIHPMGDLLFNPLVHLEDEDYGNLYISVGDGASGENAATRDTPQRLDALPGKILRITPDVTLRPDDELSANGRYRIPTTGSNPNPFLSLNLSNLKKEIYAYGFRNCHRISWDPVSNLLLENDIGLHAWEEVNIIRKGANYGYSQREGIEQLFVGGSNNGHTGSQVGVPFPSPDTLDVDGFGRGISPVYPVAAYSHRDGDGISSGFVYRGSLMPRLQGKYIFGDIPNARLFYCDLEEIIAADDRDRVTLAPIHEIQVIFKGEERRMFDIVADAFDDRGGDVSGRALPGSADTTDGNDPEGVPYGRGRADIRLALDGDGEMYVISKSDGMIRQMTAALKIGDQPVLSISVENDIVVLTWGANAGESYRVQYKTDLNEPEWTDLPGDVDPNGPIASKEDTMEQSLERYYRVMSLP